MCSGGGLSLHFMAMPRLGLIIAFALATAACQQGTSLENPTPVNLAPKPSPAPLARMETAPVPAPIEGHVEARPKDADFERRVEEARRSVDVTVYGASWCPSCKQARAWLDANGMAYSERDVDRSEEANRSAHRLNPAGTIPVIDVEGEVIVGFAPEILDRTIRRKAERKVRN
jgi:glutaredoxin